MAGKARPKQKKVGARGRIKINPKGLLKNVAKRRKKQQEALFGTDLPPGKR